MKNEKLDPLKERRRTLRADRPANYAIVAVFACALVTGINVYSVLYPHELGLEHRRNPVFFLLFLPLGYWFGGLKRFEPGALRGVYPFLLLAPFVCLASAAYAWRAALPSPDLNYGAAVLGVVSAGVGVFYYRRSLLPSRAAS
jgi:hypothetical protein